MGRNLDKQAQRKSDLDHIANERKHLLSKRGACQGEQQALRIEASKQLHRLLRSADIYDDFEKIEQDRNSAWNALETDVGKINNVLAKLDGAEEFIRERMAQVEQAAVDHGEK